MAVQVSREVFEGLERVRRSGRSNMFDRPVVQRLAYENEDYAAALWLEDNKDLYARGIIGGFEPVDGTEKEEQLEERIERKLVEQEEESGELERALLPQAERMREAFEAVDLEQVRNPLGYDHVARDWLEDGDDTLYRLDTDGDIAVCVDGERRYLTALSEDALARLHQGTGREVRLYEDGGGNLMYWDLAADAAYEVSGVLPDANFREDAEESGKDGYADWEVPAVEPGDFEADLIAVWSGGEVEVVGNPGRAAEGYLGADAPVD